MLGVKGESLDLFQVQVSVIVMEDIDVLKDNLQEFYILRV